MVISPLKSIYFNDVVLLSGIGQVQSRKDVPNEMYRIIVSPMAAIIGKKFTKSAAQNGLSLCIPRFFTNNLKVNLWNTFQNNKINENQLCFVGIGPNEKASDLGYLASSVPMEEVLVDMAFGNIPQIDNQLKNIFKECWNIEKLMIGNVVTLDGFLHLCKITQKYVKTPFIRVGIGNGSACSTYDATNVNRGQITELNEICGKIKNAFVVSDGGIRKAGHAVCAFAAGANYVLMGGFFANAVEAETNTSGDGTYWGCASEKQNKLSNLNKPNEGKERKLDKNELKNLKDLCADLWGGISSAVSYTGYKSLTDLIGNGLFEIKQNSLPPKKRH